MNTDDPRPRIARVVERVLRREVADYAEMLDKAFTAVRTEQPGTLFLHDGRIGREVRCAEWALAWGNDLVQHWAHSARDHVELIERAVALPRLLLLPAWTAARAVMEAVLLTCWLLDADVAPEMRIARAATFLLETPQGNAAMHKRIGEHAEHEERVRSLRRLVRDFEDCRFEVEWSKDRRGLPRSDQVAAVTFRGQKASVRRNMTALAEKYLPVDQHMYGLLSGAAHGEPWLVSNFDAGDTATALRAIIAPLMPASDAYTTAICRYVALDPQPYLRKRRRREMALFQAA